MTRKDLAKQIAGKTNLSYRQAENLVIAFGAVVAEALSRQEKIVYSNFGTFYTVHYPSKTIFHPKFGAARKMVMLPTNAVKWMPSENIKEQVKHSLVIENPTKHGSRKITLGLNSNPNIKFPDQDNKQQPDINNDHSADKNGGEVEIPIKKDTAVPGGEASAPASVWDGARDRRPSLEGGAPAPQKGPLGGISEGIPGVPAPVESTVRIENNPETVEKSRDKEEKDGVSIYEELMQDGSKEETTFKGSIRVPRGKSFWGRVFNRNQEQSQTPNASISKDIDTTEQNKKVSLVDSGFFHKDEVSHPISQGYGAKKIDSIKSELSRSSHTETPNTNKPLEIGVPDTEKIKEPPAPITPFPVGNPKAEISFIDLSKMNISKDVLSLIPEKLARRYKAVPVEITDKGLVVAMVDPEDIEARELIKKQVQKTLIPKLAAEADVNLILDQYSGLEIEVKQAIESADQEEASRHPQQKDDTTKILPESASENAPASRIVTSLLRRAIRDKASDIHIEPSEKEVEVRFRLDGVLKKKISLPLDIEPAVISRIKILSNLKIDEQRLPQDGRFSINFEDRQIDFRVSTMPVANGEKIVMRVLDKISGILTIEQLGINGSGLQTVKENIGKSHGMTLVTGPTGSGKTTTLYALIDKLYSEGVNIVTLEDPIEYRMPGINQSQVNAEIDYTFASGLRSIVRQDPDIIMIGEIRDAETAEMAVHAALTGHIVLSTLHTNDATGAAPRLLDMGVEPFLLTSALNMVIGQRLARKICDQCKEELQLPEEEKTRIKEEIAKMPEAEKKSAGEKEFKFYHGKGCKHCNDTGYKSRIGLYEVLGMNEKIREMILKKEASSVIQEEAIKIGMVTMLQDGILKALEGTTTIEEVWRVTKD